MVHRSADLAKQFFNFYIYIFSIFSGSENYDYNSDSPFKSRDHFFLFYFFKNIFEGFGLPMGYGSKKYRSDPGKVYRHLRGFRHDDGPEPPPSKHNIVMWTNNQWFNQSFKSIRKSIFESTIMNQ